MYQTNKIEFHLHKYGPHCSPEQQLIFFIWLKEFLAVSTNHNLISKIEAVFSLRLLCVCTYID